MAEKYFIYTDASADIDMSRFAEDEIRFVPMNYSVGDDEILCESLETEEVLKKFYDAQRNGKETRTSQITPNKYIEVFEPILKSGASVLYLSLSSGLTKTFDSVCLAARELAEEYTDVKVVPVDSFAATGGMGILAELAAKNLRDGLSIDENAEILNKMAKQVTLWFMVDDLMYLKRGGRIPAASAVIGSALNIKPILQVDGDGKLITIEKKRGQKMALKALLEKYRTQRDPQLGDRIYVVHGDASDSAETMVKMLKEENPQADITTMMLCPVIGSHTGPGMLAVIFWGDRNLK